MSLLAWTTLAAAFFLLALWMDFPARLKRSYRKWRLLRQIPRPSHLPYHWLLGHIPALYKQDEELLLRGVRELNKPANKNVALSRVNVGLYDFVTVLNPRYLGDIFKAPKTKEVYTLLIPWLGEGLLIAVGKKWFRNRRLLTPAFHYEILKGYVPVYNSCLSILLEKWTAAMQRGEAVFLFDALSLMSLDIIMQSAFSFQSNCQQAEVQMPYVKACSELVYLCSDRIMNPLHMVDSIYWFTPQGRRTRKACNLVHEHAEKVISERRESLDHNNTSDEPEKKKKYLDFLDILLMARDEEGKGMTDMEIRNEVDTFMFEGHDTTTSAMSWTLYCLAQHPQHQDKVREEVRNILKGREWLEYEDLKLLNYTMWCIKEAMRLYPPVFTFFRKSVEDIQVGEFTVPADTILRINLFLIHRNASVWENPNEYNPLRFVPSNMEKHGPYDYIPFSAGSRNCIGQTFAMNEMKVVVGTVVNRFKLKLDDTHRVEMVPRVILRSKNDIKIHLTVA